MLQGAHLLCGTTVVMDEISTRPVSCRSGGHLPVANVGPNLRDAVSGPANLLAGFDAADNF